MSRSKNKKISSIGKPLVSICTPTYNRRSFIRALISCYEAQTYPRDRMEWIVVDDGDDPVGDLFECVQGVKYFRSENKMKLGYKRNFMHSKASGDILVYMDDDDYYPPDRVLHAVNTLQSRPNVLVAGSSILHIYFNNRGKIYRFGPYGPNHATAATFAFKKELLLHTSYSDEANVSEERFFLRGYNIPMVQLDPKKTILVFAHAQNTYNKNQLLSNPDPMHVKETKLLPRVFIKDADLCDFYVNQ